MVECFACVIPPVNNLQKIMSEWVWQYFCGMPVLSVQFKQCSMPGHGDISSLSQICVVLLPQYIWLLSPKLLGCNMCRDLSKKRPCKTPGVQLPADLCIMICFSSPPIFAVGVDFFPDCIQCSASGKLHPPRTRSSSLQPHGMSFQVFPKLFNT